MKIQLPGQQEEKFIKRIGWITLFDAEKFYSIKDVLNLLDLKKMGIRERLDYFDKIPGLIQGVTIFENLTPMVGFRQLTKAQTGNIASVAEISVNVHAMGSDDGTILPLASSNTQLGAETVRKTITSRAYDENKALYTIFYGASEGNGTHHELALYMNADPMVADDGDIWDRSLMDITKLNTQTLTLDYEDTYVNG